MADFKDIIRDWKRMCDYYSQDDDSCCQSCPITLAGKDCYAIYEVDDAAYFDEIENTISKWAAEHPEPEYPTWGDWLAEMKLVSWEDNGDGIHSVMVPTFKMCTQIPVGMAQKLGIEPKEG